MALVISASVGIVSLALFFLISIFVEHYFAKKLRQTLKVEDEPGAYLVSNRYVSSKTGSSGCMLALLGSFLCAWFTYQAMG